MNNHKEMPHPPRDLSRAGMQAWFDISTQIIQQGRFHEDVWDQVDKLARIEEARERLIDKLELHPEQEDPDGFQPVIDFIHLREPEEFDKRFLDYVSESESYPEAYFKVEMEHRLSFGENKYSSYDSFRAARYKRIKKKLNKM